MTYVSWSRAYDVLRRHRTRLLARAGVLAVDVGVRVRGGRPTRTPALRIHVERKLPRDQLGNRRPFESALDGVPIDVLGGGYAPLACRPAAWPLRLYRNPLLGGIAIGCTTKTSFGTLAAIVEDGAGASYALTAQHVVVTASPGATVQPESPFAIGAPAASALDPTMDAAIVALGDGRSVLPGVAGTPRIDGIVDPIPLSKLPFAVRIVGACSGASSGFVTSRSFSMPVPYPGGTVIEFVEQLHIVRAPGTAEFSRAGDSGALVLEQDGTRAVGLLFAGEGSGADFGMATPIRRVLDRFAVTLA